MITNSVNLTKNLTKNLQCTVHLCLKITNVLKSKFKRQLTLFIL